MAGGTSALVQLLGCPEELREVEKRDGMATAEKEMSALHEAAARCLRELAVSRAACRLLDGSGAADALSQLLRSRSAAVREAAAWALCTIACSPEQQASLTGGEAIPQLLALADAGSDGALWVLHNLGASRENVSGLVGAGLVAVMVAALGEGRADLAREAAARSLSNVACYSEETSAEVAAAGALPALLAMLRAGCSKHSRTAAAMAVCQLALWPRNADALGEHAPELVQQLARLLPPPIRASSSPMKSPTTSSRALQEVATSAMQNLAACGPQLRRAILDEPLDVVGRLVALLLDGTAVAAVEAAGALLNLCAAPNDFSDCLTAANAADSSDKCSKIIRADAVRAVVSAGGQHALVRMLDEPLDTASAAAAALRGMLLNSPAGRHAALRADCLPALVGLLKRVSQAGAGGEADAAALRWLAVESAAGVLAALSPAELDEPAAAAAAPLVKLLSTRMPPRATAAVCHAVAAIAQRSDSHRARLSRMSGANSAVSLLAAVLPRRLAGAEARAAAADALAALASDGDAARSAVAKAALPELLRMADPSGAVAASSAGEQRAAAALLGELARGQRVRHHLLASGAEAVLKALCCADGVDEVAATAGADALRLLRPPQSIAGAIIAPAGHVDGDCWEDDSVDERCSLSLLEPAPSWKLVSTSLGPTSRSAQRAGQPVDLRLTGVSLRVLYAKFAGWASAPKQPSAINGRSRRWMLTTAGRKMSDFKQLA